MTEPVEKTEKQTSSYDRTLLGNRYQLRGRIESGGMGDVFEARDTLLNREVAIKILKPELSQEPSVVARFKRESEVSAKLTGHPNIVQVLDRGQHEDGRLYIVMELIHGNDLATEINMHSGGDKKMPLDSVLRIFRSIAVAAAHAHAQGVIHRDLNPGNVMIASYRVTKKTED